LDRCKNYKAGGRTKDSVRKRLDTIFPAYVDDRRLAPADRVLGPRGGTTSPLSHFTTKGRSMFTSQQYRDKAAEYKQLTETAVTSNEKREYRNLEQQFTTLADNEEWMIAHRDQTVHAAEQSAVQPGSPQTVDLPT
jgi:hypothetical protein